MYIQVHYFTLLKEVIINKVPPILLSLHFERSKIKSQNIFKRKNCVIRSVLIRLTNATKYITLSNTKLQLYKKR